MTANTPASRKAKGRLAAQETRNILLNFAGTSLEPDDIKVTSSSVTGEDLALSPRARDIFPFVFEVKCQESLNIWSAITQAEAHAKGTHWDPVVVFKRNHQKLRAIIDFELLCKLLVQIFDGEKL